MNKGRLDFETGQENFVGGAAHEEHSLIGEAVHGRKKV
jgi:hypothetical protein